MKRKNTARNALFTSIISLLLCVSMLVGATFAWFTDTVESDTNKIIAGNLDVELYHSNRVVSDERVVGNTLLFDDIELWEPGAVVYENFNIKNKGNLNLKYQFKLNFTDATDNGKGGTLADVLKVAVVPDEFIGERVDAQNLWNDDSVSKEYLATFAKSGELTPQDEDGDEDFYAVIIYWEPSDRDNDYNMKADGGAAKDPLSIKVSVELVATQVEAELDSFDEKYDEDADEGVLLPTVVAEVWNASDLKNALEAGKTAKLMTNITLDQNIVIETGVTAGLDLNGYMLTIASAASTYSLRATSSLINVLGNLIITDNVGGGKIFVEENGTGIAVSGDATVTLDGGELNVGEGATGILLSDANNAEVNLNAGNVTGEGTGVKLESGSADIVIKDDVNNGQSAVKVETNGNANIEVEGDAVPKISGENAANTADEIQRAINNAADGETVNIAAGTYELKNQLQVENKSITIIGLGEVTLNGTANNSHVFQLRNGASGAANENMTVTIKNVTIGGTYKSAIMVRNDLDLNVEDVVFTGSYEWSTLQVENSYDNESMFDGIVNVNAKNVVSDKVTMAADDDRFTYFNYENCQFGVMEVQNLGGKVFFNNVAKAPGLYAEVSNADELNVAVKNGVTNLTLADGEYNIYGCEGKTLTINGSKNAVLKVMNEGEDGCDYGFGSSAGVGDITFNGVTIDTTANNGNYKGYAYMKGTFNDCNFVGAYSLNNANDFVFNRCTFDFKNGYFWTWDANTATFNECTFGGNSKNILAHGYASTVININDCDFVATEMGYTGDGDHTAAVEIDPAGTNTYIININCSNVSDNYSGWVRIKDGSTGHSITLDGFEMVADGLTKKGVTYNVSNANGLEKLNAMMADKSAGRDVVVNLTADIDFVGKTWTPVDSHADTKFEIAEINGNGHTIYNLTINGQAMFTRFAGSGDVVIKDITFDNATVDSNGKINTSILTVQSYQNVLLDNVDVKNSKISGGYKVAPLIATVYNESSSTVTATLKNCDVENVTVTASTYDFCTTGMVAFVNAGDNDKIEFENCTVTDVRLYAPDDNYKAHAAVYTTGSGSLFNEAAGVTVTNCTFEAIS